MKVSTSLSAIALLAISAFARPASHLKRAGDDGSVELCTGAGLTGICTYEPFAFDTCVNVTAGFDNDVSSLRFAFNLPAEEGWLCVVYDESGCAQGPFLDIVTPNTTQGGQATDLAEVGWDKEVSSFQCQVNVQTE